MDIYFLEGKFKWSKGPMRHSGWSCDFSYQKSGELWNKMHPFDILCSVFTVGKKWRWRVELTGWEGGRTETLGDAETPEQAVAEAERVAEQHWRALMPEWATEALMQGWRPPATGGRFCAPPPA